jgi:tRNA threonylcarbamoyladenosine biosynthesis protein TsaB
VIVLGIETSGEVGSVVLRSEDSVLAERTLPEGGHRARDLVSAIDDVVRAAGLAKADVSAVAVSQGPGAFTGLRVGVTCAKTLAYALGWALVGVPSLEVLVQNVGEQAARRCRFACPLRDARRRRVYGTAFEWDGAQWRDTTGVLLREPAELAGLIPQGALVFGSGARAYPQEFPSGRFEVGAASMDTGRAEAVAMLGLRLVRTGVRADPMQLVPLYYRLTEAEEKLPAADIRR